ncbi:MAG: methionine--tRNA ligase [Deltaproteobacteria bacterium]|nr:methionine--tRNA ligase [Deltaproteobacteria bacterium]MDQ3301387.1 methionine--tRNA ligase [Myxococcota bacterium]
MSTFYITTPIYYVNDIPHLGHAYTTIVCDAIARFHRMRGDDTRFLTGTDEHGQKIEEAANKRGLTPQQLVDQVAPRFDEMWKTLGLEGYRFIRTTDTRHKKVVGELWRKIRATNPDDLYLASYQGWYCVGCEAFYTESQLVKDADQWMCAVHKRPVNWLDKERSWFFKLSRYAEPLLRHIEAHPEFIRPDAYRREIISFLESGLRDLSVSRTSFQWGIAVPEADPDGLAHVIYVWMDALTNYLSDLCAPDGSIGGPDVEKYWPQAIHVIGKDILRFHTVYWPAFLMAAGLPLPKSICAHGWWTVRGEKISKSMPATRIDPLTLADALGQGSPLGRAIGIDAMRYYLLREVPLGNDGDFTFESLFGRFNAELANDLGNLINRSLTLITKFAVEHPPVRDDAQYGATENPFWQLEVTATETCATVARQFEALAPSRALELIWRFVGVANRFIDQTQPWAMAKAKNPALAHTLWALQASLYLLARLIAPVLPATSRALRDYLGDTSTEPLTWPKSSDGRVLDEAPSSLLAKPPHPLFPRLDDKMQAQIVRAVVGDAAVETAGGDDKLARVDGKPEKADKKADHKADKKALAADNATKPAEVPAGAITVEDFGRIELRVGKVLTAVAVPKAKKLLHLSVDLGEPAPRSIIAGVAEAYSAEQLVGKQVIVVANLAPATIRGIRSEGMLLAAGDEAILGLSALDHDVPPGTRVR